MSDPLTHVLQLLNARAAMSSGLVAGGPWSVRVERYEGLKFNAVVRGEAWLRVGEGQALRVCAGDCFMLAGGAPFVVASDPALPPSDAATVFANAPDGVARIGSAEEVYILGGRMTLEPALAPLLTEALPQVVVLQAGTPQAETVQWLLQRLVAEVAADAPGGAVMKEHLLGIMFVELIRVVSAGSDGRPGLLTALAEPRIGRALRAMHADPARAWKLPALAAEAHMSRSHFAQRFRELVGVPPLDYLKRWRLHRAERALREQGISVAAAAELAGYASESAFGYAFRRSFGRSPRRHAGLRRLVGDGR